MQTSPTRKVMQSRKAKACAWCWNTIEIGQPRVHKAVAGWIVSSGLVLAAFITWFGDANLRLRDGSWEQLALALWVVLSWQAVKLWIRRRVRMQSIAR